MQRFPVGSLNMPRNFRMLVLDPAVIKNGMVPRRGLEPPHPFGYQHLKLARLPIPPSGRRRAMYGGGPLLSTGFLKFSWQSAKKRFGVPETMAIEPWSRCMPLPAEA